MFTPDALALDAEHAALEDMAQDECPDAKPDDEETIGGCRARDNWRPEDAPIDLAMAVLLRACHDLEHGTRTQQQSARSAVIGGTLEFWLEVLPISDKSRARVLSMLENLASAVPVYKR